MLKMKTKELFFFIAALNLTLWGMYSFATISHFTGDYTSEGILVLANGASKNIKTTTTVNENDVFEIMNIDGLHMEFYRKIFARLFNNYRMLNSTEDTIKAEEDLYGDDRLVFNYLYSARRDSSITVKKIFTAEFGSCFYITELKKLRCISQ